MTKAELAADLSYTVEAWDRGVHLRDLNAVYGPLQATWETLDLLPSSSPDQREQYAHWLNQIPLALSAHRDATRLGVERKARFRRKQIEALLPQIEWVTGPAGPLRAFRGSVGEGQRSSDGRLLGAADAAIAAYVDFAHFLRAEVLPDSVDDDAVGRDEFSWLASTALGADFALEDTYDWALHELEGLRLEQSRVARNLVGSASPAAAARMLDSDPSMALTASADLLAWARATHEATVASVGTELFDLDLKLAEIDFCIAPPTSDITYYVSGGDDPRRRGRVWLRRPTASRPVFKWRARTVLNHEAVPGHHLQSVAAHGARTQISAWQRLLGGSVGQREGWGLYAERLMGDVRALTDSEYFGMLQGQVLRAARVVLDIGLHIHNERKNGPQWTQARAVRFLVEEIHLDEPAAQSEVLRYLATPGQAMSYMVGYRYWRDLRREYLDRQRGRATVRDFHRRALEAGPTRLDNLWSSVLQD